MSESFKEQKGSLEAMRPVRGMRDFVGSDAAHFYHVVDVLRDVALRHGFGPVEIPIVEFTSLFARGLGEETDVVGKEMFTFQDRSDQSLSLRPEGTASAVRAFLTAKLTQTLPQKWFYWGPMFRYDRPQKGRYRQFYQFGVESLGSSTSLSDVEIIALFFESLKALSITQTTLFLNSLGDADSRAAYKTALVEHLSRYASELSADSQRRLQTNPLRVLDSKDPQDQRLMEDAPSILDFLTPDASRFFDRVKEKLSQLGIAFTIDPHLVRGLDYYDHTTFELKAALDEESPPLAVAGGGRYNGLIQSMGGPPIPATGAAFGIDRLLLLAPQPHRAPFTVGVLFAEEGDFAEAWKIAQRLREAFAFPVLFPTEGDLSKRLKYAHKSGVACVLILGQDERQKEGIRCKSLTDFPNLPEGQEKVVLQKDLLAFVSSLNNREGH